MREKGLSHAVVGYIFVDDFSPPNSRPNPTFEVRNPYEILLAV